MNDFGFGFDPYNPDQNSFGNDVNTDSSNGTYIPDVSDCRSCGVCVNTCPTYRATSKEAYSPRGRVRLIDRLINDGEPLSEDELKALQACTLCRTCEQVCPSKMAYGELFNQAHEKLSEQTDNKPSWIVQMLLHHFSTRRWLQNLTGTLIQSYQQCGLQWLIHKLPFRLLQGDLKQLDALLPPNHSSEKIPYYSRALTPARYGKVALFSGCLSNTFDTQTHNDTIKLLTRLGYEVYVPKTQTCCGAMHAHNGDIEIAKQLARKNIDAFSESRVTAVVFNSSGCGAFLGEYQTLLNLDNQTAQPKLLRAVTDVLGFLQKINWPDSPTFRASRIKVAVHEPCSQRNQLQNQSSVYELLNKIPAIEVAPLEGNNLCCGAGGTRMITHPELANPIRDEKVKALIESGAEILVSSNMACAMHLAAGVREAGKEIEVIHPVQLLARQLI